MKQGIHPDYHMITVAMTDGTEYTTRSTWGKEGDRLQLDIDPKTHPAWVGGTKLRKTGQMEKFSNKFAFLDTKPAAEARAEPEAAAEAAEPAPAPAAAAPKAKKDKKDA